MKYKTEIKWGIAFTLVALLWMVFEKAMGWHGPKIDQHPVMTNLFAPLAIALYVFALRDKRNKDLGGEMTWKQGFVSGLIVTAVITILSPISQLITHFVITPEYFPHAIRYAVESGKLTQEQAESYFNLSSYLYQSVIGALVMGVLTAAIVAYFLRRKKSAGSPEN